MKLLVDCDNVFDRLTRGPFPSGEEDDSAVEGHLSVCHECRRLAEALRPAVSLLHEAYADEQISDERLPAYHGTPDRSTDRAITRASGGQWSLGWQLVAASLLGVMIGSLAINALMEGRGQGSQPVALAQPAENGASGLTRLAVLKLSETCLPSGMALASNSAAKLSCCTDCHSSSAAAKRNIDVGRLQLACVACHSQ